MDKNYTFIGDFKSPAVAAVLSLNTLAALIANITVLSITLYQRKSWKQSSTIFFTSLILAHLVMNILYLPFTIIALAAGEWIFGSTDEEKRGTCNFAAFSIWYTVLVISMTVAAISFDRFLFIVKPHLHKRFMGPWVALTLTITIWLLSAILSSTPFYGLGKFTYLEWAGSCMLAIDGYSFVGYVIPIALFVAVTSVLIITSTWTFFFTYKFLQDQSTIAGDNVYSCQKKRLFGIFGAMLIVYGICLMPSFVVMAIVPLIGMEGQVVAVTFIFFHLLTVLNPVVQSYFRPGFREIILKVIMKWRSYKSRSNATSMSILSPTMP